MLEQHGVRIAAVSYDSQEVLAKFAKEHGIGFPLLSDQGSAAIRRFGIFNYNMAPGLRSYGVPHPVNYRVAPDGTVMHKYFVPNYQHRVTGSAVALQEFGTTDDGAAAVTVRSGAVTARIGLSGARAFAGQEIGFFAKFEMEPGWHIYGAPLPEAYTATAVRFDEAKVSRQSFTLPEAKPMEIAPLSETLPVYSGSVGGTGSLLLRFPMEAGETTLSGKLSFQSCSDTVCEAPQTVAFELPLSIETFLVPQRKK